MQMLLQVDDGKGSLMTVFIGELGRSDLIVARHCSFSIVCCPAHTQLCLFPVPSQELDINTMQIRVLARLPPEAEFALCCRRR